MNEQAEINVNFYGSLSDFTFSEPYAVLSNREISSILKRCDGWVSMIATHPNLVDLLGDSIVTHIKLITALRLAVRESMQAGLFPNVIFSPSEYRATMSFISEIRGQRTAAGIH